MFQDENKRYVNGEHLSALIRPRHLLLSRTFNPSLHHQVVHILLQVFNATSHFFQYKVKEDSTWNTGTYQVPQNLRVNSITGADKNALWCI